MPENAETLPCGCKTGTAVVDGVNTFFFAPCSLDCEYYKYTIEESKRQGKPVEFKMVDE